MEGVWPLRCSGGNTLLRWLILTHTLNSAHGALSSKHQLGLTTHCGSRTSAAVNAIRFFFKCKLLQFFGAGLKESEFWTGTTFFAGIFSSLSPGSIPSAQELKYFTIFAAHLFAGFPVLSGQWQCRWWKRRKILQQKLCPTPTLHHRVRSSPEVGGGRDLCSEENLLTATSLSSPWP